MPINKKITTQPTIYGALIDTCLRHNIPYQPEPYWTLNERYQIHHNTVVPGTSKLEFGWFTAGNGGTVTIAGSNGMEKRLDNPMSAEDSGIYRPIPFIIRPINADLSPAERTGYAMRAKITGMGNTDYWGYFAKRIIRPSTNPVIKKITVVDGVSTITDFTATSENNAPIPPVIPIGQANSTNGIYFTPSYLLDLSLTDVEYDEYQAAAEAIYGDRAYGYISEVGIIAAYEATVPVLSPTLVPTASNYTEILRATITNRLELDVGGSASGFQLILDSAASLPQYGISITQNP